MFSNLIVTKTPSHRAVFRHFFHRHTQKPLLSIADANRFVTPHLDQDPEAQCQKVYKHFSHKLTMLPISDQKNLAKPHDASTESIWSKISLEDSMGSSTHLDMNTPAEIYNEFKGSLLSYYDEDKKGFKKSDRSDLSGIDCIAMGGMDFYTMEHFGALRKYSKSFFAGLSQQPAPDSRLLYCYPLHNKEDRYEELLNFHTMGGDYASTEMLKFAYIYVLPKIINGEKLEFFCFSASCREFLMIEHACRQFLNDAYPDTAHTIMGRVSAVLFGYAFDHLDNDHFSFNKLIITSVEDFGVLRPYFNRTLIYGCSIFNYGVSFIYENTEHSNSLAIVFGIDSLPMSLFGKANTNGHLLPHYIDGFNKNLIQPDSMTI